MRREKKKPDSDELGRRNRELSILNVIARELNRSVDMDQILRTALAQVAELFDLQTGWVWLLREETGESYLAAAQNLPPALAENPHLMEGRCYCLDTYRAGDMRGAANVNVVECSRLYNLVDGTDGLRFHASIPLYAHGKKLGVLNVASGNWRELSPEDLRLLYTVGDLLSIAIERARLFGRSVQMGAVEERYRLAREIHDTLGQGLAAILLRLESVDALLESGAGPEGVRQAVGQTLQMARTSLEEARRSVLDLRAASLEGRSLAEALAALAEGASERGGLRVSFEATGGGRPLPVRVEASLYRIAQEAVINAVRHAAARRVDVRLVATPDRVQLVVEDDGRGFDPSQVPKGHYGLIGLNERARLLDGHMNLESSPGAGTRLEVVIPLKVVS